MASQLSASAQKTIRTPTSRTSLGSGIGIRSHGLGLLPPNVTDRASSGRRQTFIPNLRGQFTLPRSPHLAQSEEPDPSSANDNQERQRPESIDDDGHEEDFTTFQHSNADLFNGQGGIFNQCSTLTIK